MKYMGSKNRIAKHILPIMLDQRGARTWVEPFVGGGNMIDKIKGERIGADSNRYAIEALISIRDCVNELPKNNKEFTEEDYKKLKLDDLYPYKGYFGFTASYGGKWLGGWRRGESRDYIRESYDNAVKQSPLLQGVKLICAQYSYLIVPENSLVYCDPPYAGTTKYKDNFDHNAFWKWCRQMACLGHPIFVSEYNAPSDFECVWSKDIISSLTANTGAKKGKEKLFRYRHFPWY